MRIKFIYILTLILLSAACDTFTPPVPASSETLAEPISDLTNEQLRIHLSGDAEFARVFASIDGLGPIFVQNSCESCHAGDGKGNPFNNLTRFGRYDDDGNWSSLKTLGGPQLQHRAIGDLTGKIARKC